MDPACFVAMRIPRTEHTVAVDVVVVVVVAVAVAVGDGVDLELELCFLGGDVRKGGVGDEDDTRDGDPEDGDAREDVDWSHCEWKRFPVDHHVVLVVAPIGVEAAVVDVVH